MNSFAIKVDRLTRTYQSTKGKYTAVNNISFSVQSGSIFGFLGPNGAGKTTTIKMLTTLLLPTSGDVNILGFDAIAHPKAIRSQINFVFGGDRGLYNRLTGRQNLQFFADLYRIPDRISRLRIAQLLEKVDLIKCADMPVEKYSKGMKQRLHIARSLVNSPRLIFLDEPTLGLDPIGIRDLRSIISELKEQGITVFLTTHYMSDVEALCDQITVIRGGEIIANGTVSEIKELIPQNFRINITLSKTLTSQQTDDLNEMKEICSITAENNTGYNKFKYSIIYDSRDVLPVLLKQLSPMGILSLEHNEPTLEDAFIKLTR